MPIETCKHPPERLYTWLATNEHNGAVDVLCIACCACGTVLRGAAE